MLKGTYLTEMISDCRDIAIQLKTTGHKNLSEVMTMAAKGYEATLKEFSLDELMQDLEIGEKK